MCNVEAPESVDKVTGSVPYEQADGWVYAEMNGDVRATGNDEGLV